MCVPMFNCRLNIKKNLLVLVVTGKSGESSETQLEGEYHLVGVKVGQIGEGAGGVALQWSEWRWW